MSRCACNKDRHILCETAKLLRVNWVAAFKRYNAANVNPTLPLSEKVRLEEKYQLAEKAYFSHVEGEDY